MRRTGKDTLLVRPSKIRFIGAGFAAEAKISRGGTPARHTAAISRRGAGLLGVAAFSLLSWTTLFSMASSVYASPHASHGRPSAAEPGR